MTPIARVTSMKAWVLVAIGYEPVRRRRLDRIYGVGLVILLVAPARLALMQWAPWVRMMRAVLQSLM